jgi:alpha-glucosidase
VTLDGTALAALSSRAAYDAATSGWFNAGGNLILAKGLAISARDSRTFAVTLQ